MSSRPFTIGFGGRADPAHAAEARAYEDAVLPLLEDHGAKLLYRGIGIDGPDAAQPIEFQLIWFPSRAAYLAYVGDERRVDLLTRYGDVFTDKTIVDLETVAAFAPPPDA